MRALKRCPAEAKVYFVCVFLGCAANEAAVVGVLFCAIADVDVADYFRVVVIVFGAIAVVLRCVPARALHCNAAGGVCGWRFCCLLRSRWRKGARCGSVTCCCTCTRSVGPAVAAYFYLCASQVRTAAFVVILVDLYRRLRARVFAFTCASMRACA